MRAAVLERLREPVRIAERQRPEPAAGEILVRIRASGICHSDLHVLDGDTPPTRPLPLVLGHEGAGTVESVGPGAAGPIAAGGDAAGWKIGDRAGIPWMRWACGRCRECVEGWENLCAAQRGTGFDDDGCWAEFAVCPAAFAARIPEELSFEQAAPVLCAGVTAYRAVRIARARPGRTLGVFGIGGLGHLGLQYARLMGARVIAVDVHPAKLALAESLGADACVDASRDGAARALLARGGVDDAVIFATSGRAVQDAVEALNRLGTVVIAALPPGDVRVKPQDLADRGLRLVGTSLGTRQDLTEALEIAMRRGATARVETCSLEEVNPILEAMRAHRLDAARKVILF